MTQQINTISTPPAPQPLNLGEVTFQGHTYVAILHYCGEDGVALPITKGMEGATQEYRKFLQQMLNEAGQGQGNVPKALLHRVSTAGFIFAGDDKEESAPASSSHEKLKTVDAWGKFLFCLAKPELAPHVIHSNSSIEFVNISDLTRERRKELFDSISEKVNNALRQKSDKIPLTKDEEKLLTAWGCHHMKKEEIFDSVAKEEWANVLAFKELLLQSAGSSSNT